MIVRTSIVFAEVVCVIIAVVAGGFWLYNPNGPFEPITFMATLVGTTIIDMFRRRLSAKETIDEINKANTRMLQAVTETVLSRIDKVSHQLDEPGQNLLQQQLVDQLPQLIRDALAELTNEIHLSNATQIERVDGIKTAIEKTIAEAYGVDIASVVVGDVSLEEAKPWRFAGLNE